MHTSRCTNVSVSCYTTFAFIVLHVLLCRYASAFLKWHLPVRVWISRRFWADVQNALCSLQLSRAIQCFSVTGGISTTTSLSVPYHIVPAAIRCWFRSLDPDLERNLFALLYEQTLTKLLRMVLDHHLLCFTTGGREQEKHIRAGCLDHQNIVAQQALWMNPVSWRLTDPSDLGLLIYEQKRRLVGLWVHRSFDKYLWKTIEGDYRGTTHCTENSKLAERVGRLGILQITQMLPHFYLSGVVKKFYKDAEDKQKYQSECYISCKEWKKLRKNVSQNW